MGGCKGKWGKQKEKKDGSMAMLAGWGRKGGAYRWLLLPETWSPEPAWALDAHVEQFTVMEL